MSSWQNPPDVLMWFFFSHFHPWGQVPQRWPQLASSWRAQVASPEKVSYLSRTDAVIKKRWGNISHQNSPLSISVVTVQKLRSHQKETWSPARTEEPLTETASVHHRTTHLRAKSSPDKGCSGCRSTFGCNKVGPFFSCPNKDKINYYSLQFSNKCFLYCD